MNNQTKECPDCGSTSWNIMGFACQHELCPKALEADGEKLRQITGQDHGPFELPTLLICPRCKQRCLNPNDYGESAIYRSKHKICVPCIHAEDAEIDREGTNDLPETLKAYGPENDYD